MIEIDGVTCRYDGPDADGAVAVDDVSLRLADGEWTLLVGANGSGKTTLVRTLNGLVEPTAGEVRVHGTAVAEDPTAARQAVGMVFQTPRDGFVAATVGADVAFGPENLGLSRTAIDDRVERALSAVGMAGRREERIDELSGGERERVAVAGALAMDPDHLVLDEPFTGLDAPARDRLLDRLDALDSEGTGLVVVTHDPGAVLDRADRVVGLVDGAVAVDAPPAVARQRLSGLGVRID